MPRSCEYCITGLWGCRVIGREGAAAWPLCSWGPPVQYQAEPSINRLALALMGVATSLCSGNGGGFAALEASLRRVAGVSRL